MQRSHIIWRVQICAGEQVFQEVFNNMGAVVVWVLDLKASNLRDKIHYIGVTKWRIWWEGGMQSEQVAKTTQEEEYLTGIV